MEAVVLGRGARQIKRSFPESSGTQPTPVNNGCRGGKLLWLGSVLAHSKRPDPTCRHSHDPGNRWMPTGQARPPTPQVPSVQRDLRASVLWVGQSAIPTARGAPHN